MIVKSEKHNFVIQIETSSGQNVNCSMSPSQPRPMDSIATASEYIAFMLVCK